jgi:hypothetical protein
MRAGPLSNSGVISLLNRYYVPVSASNEIFGPRGTGPADERAEYGRIVAAFESAHLGTGDVHVYILSPDGRPAAGLSIDRATDTAQLSATLTQVVKQLGTQPGEPVIRPKPQSQGPQSSPDQMVLHVSARHLRAGTWAEFPGENWVVLDEGEWKKLLPPAGAAAGTTWDIDPAISRKLLTTFYPPTEDTTSADRNRIEQQFLKATLVSVTDGAALARLDGELRMERSFYPGHKNYDAIKATLIGFMDFKPGGRTIESLAMATEKATFGSENFTAALHTLTGASVAEKKP